MKRTRRVALIYDAKLPYDVKVMRGVGRYLHQTGGWNVFIEERALGDQRLPDLRTWRLDGVAADLDDPHVAEAVRKLKVPVVGFGGGYGWRPPAARIPYVKSDNAAVSRLGVAHLLERGFRHFAFCGYPPTRINGWSAERESAFVSLLARHGFQCSVYRGKRRTEPVWELFYHSLGGWLRTLAHPLGLMAANDKRARQVLEACRLVGLRVPDDVAVIGVDNDEMICGLSDPTLSSIEQGCDETGYLVAATLDAMMNGRMPARAELVVGPEGIVARQSTDVVAVEDPRVARALELIREHACDGWKVAHLVKALNLSRSTLENHFQSALHRTVAGELRRVRLEHVRGLLATTMLPLKQIAGRCGFRSIQHLTSVFHRHFGETPAQYRRSGGRGSRDPERPARPRRSLNSAPRRSSRSGSA